MYQPQQNPQQVQLFNAAGQPVAISVPPQSSDYASYQGTSSKIAGIMLVLLGCASIVFGVLDIVFTGAAYGTGPTDIVFGIMVSKFLCISYLTRDTHTHTHTHTRLLMGLYRVAQKATIKNHN